MPRGKLTFRMKGFLEEGEDGCETREREKMAMQRRKTVV